MAEIDDPQLVSMLRNASAEYRSFFMSQAADRMEDLIDSENRYCAIMDTLNVDFNDIFPDWDNNED